MPKPYSENDISKVIVDVAYNIHVQYGPGLFESVYEEIMCYELIKRSLNIKMPITNSTCS
jgi:GxxExxY protein